MVDRFVDSLSPKEQISALRMVSNLQSIFKKFEEEGYLRDKLRGTIERTDFLRIVADSDKLFKAHNMLFHIFERKDRSKEFIEFNKRFGLHQKGLAYLFLSESIATFQRSVELFKNSLLFTLKFGRGFWSKMTLGRPLRKLINVTGTKGEILAQEIDVDLRNALAHGLFWMDGFELIYYEDVTLKKQKRIRLYNLWMKTRKQSILTQCLLKLIADWYAGT